jgi:hypothetical protein
VPPLALWGEAGDGERSGIKGSLEFMGRMTIWDADRSWLNRTTPDATLAELLRPGIVAGDRGFEDFDERVEMVSLPCLYWKTVARGAGFFPGLFFKAPALFGGMLFLHLIRRARSQNTGPGDIARRGKIGLFLRLRGLWIERENAGKATAPGTARRKTEHMHPNELKQRTKAFALRII